MEVIHNIYNRGSKDYRDLKSKIENARKLYRLLLLMYLALKFHKQS